MATRTLKQNYSNKGITTTTLLYDPINGNSEIVETGVGGQKLFQNGEFTNLGKQIYTIEEQNQILKRVANDIRSASRTVDGQVQSWAQNPETTDQNPTTSGPGISTTTTNTDPLAPLPTGDIFKSGKFEKFYRYPSTIENGQDRLVITQYQYRRTGATQTESDLKEGKALSESLGSVILPMPNDLSESNSVGWGDDSLSNAAALLMGPATDAVNKAVKGNILGALQGSGESLKNAIIDNEGVNTRLTQYLTTRAAASLIGKLGINVNPEAYISRVTSGAVNPNLELLFNGPKLRQFSLAYKLTARSESEAKQIRGILRFFKKGMAPQRTQSQEFSFYLGTPNVFKVQFKSNAGVLKSIGQFKTCALVSFSANYTPDGFYAVYEDGNANGSQPISVVMQMGFTELLPIFNDEYGDDDMYDVGPNTFSEGYKFDSTTTTTTSPSSSPTPQTPTERGGGNPYQGTGGPPTPTEKGGGNPYGGTRGNRNNNPYGS